MTLREANAYVEQFHRHHRPVVGHKFSIGCTNGEKIVGVAIVGRPVSRHLDDGWTLEVNRLCTDGTRNACSMLYAADVEPVLRSEWVAECVLPGDGWAFEDVPYDPHQHSGPLCKRCRKTALLNGGEDYVCSNYCPNCGARMKRGTDA